jgi:NitT/TauT family transport system permease protein
MWQIVCTLLEVPPYLVPTPALIAKTLVADGAC